MTSIRNNADIKDTSHKRGIRKQEDYKPPQELLDKLVNTFWVNNPYIKDFKKSNELEVRFGTRGIKPLTKIDYDNVICKIKSLGFTCQNEQGEYMLRVYNEFLDPATGVFRDSDIRTEINGFHDIQTYCKRNSLLEVEAGKMGNIQFFRKKNYKGVNDVEAIRPINFDEFNFRVS